MTSHPDTSPPEPLTEERSGPAQTQEKTMTAREAIFHEIENERAHQEKKWGNEADDTKNAPNDWVAYISHHATRWFAGGFPPYSDEEIDDFRASMLEVAALAVAAIESQDRQSNTAGKPFYARDSYSEGL